MDDTSQQETEEVAQLLIAMQQQHLPEQQQWQQQQLWQAQQPQQQQLLHQQQAQQFQEQQLQQQQLQERQEQQQYMQQQRQQLQLQEQDIEQKRLQSQPPSQHSQEELQGQSSQQDQQPQLLGEAPTQLGGELQAQEAPEQGEVLEEQQEGQLLQPGEEPSTRTAQEVLQEFITMLSRQQELGEPMNVQQIQQYFHTCGVDPAEISRLLDKQQQDQQQRELEQQLEQQQQQQQLLEQQQQQQLLEQQQLKQQQQQQQLLEQQQQQQLQQQQLEQQQQQQLNQQQLVEQQLQQLVAENQQQLQLGQQFGYPQHVIQQQMAQATSDGDAVQQEQQETMTVYIVYSDENAAAAAQQGETISSSSLLESVMNSSVTTSTAASMAQNVVYTPSTQQMGQRGGVTARGRGRGQLAKSLIQQSQNVTVGAQSPMTLQGTATNIGALRQQNAARMQRSQFVMPSPTVGRMASPAGGRINNTRMVAAGGAMQTMMQTVARSPRKPAPLQQQRHSNSGGFTTIRTTSSLQSGAAQRLAGCNVTTPHSPAQSQRFAMSQQSPAVGPMAQPRPASVASVLPPGGAALDNTVSDAPDDPLKIAAEASGASLVKGQEYTLQYPTGRTFNAIWDGTFFKMKVATSTRGPTAGIVTSVSQPMNAYEGGQVRGGGGGNRKMQPKTIRGNSTGMNMVSSSAQQAVMSSGSTATGTSTVQQAFGLANGGRRWNHSSIGKEKLTRPSIRNQLNSDEVNTSESAGVTSTTETSPEGSVDDVGVVGATNAIVAKPLKRPSKPTEHGKFAVCNHCGSYSEDYDNCDSCGKLLPDEPKFFWPQQNHKVARTDKGATATQLVLVTNMPGNKSPVVGKKQFYGNAAATSKFVQGPQRRVNVKTKNPVQKLVVTTAKKVGRIRKKVHQIETVTILSSDDEESHVATATGASVPTAVVHPLTPSVAIASTSDVTSQAESPLVPTAATLTTTSQLYVSRRQRMEDEHGNIVRPPVTETPAESEPQIDQPQVAPQVAPPVAACTTASHVTLMSRSIRIGSLRSTAQEPVTITPLGIQLCIQCHNERLELCINATDLVKIIAHFGPQMPLLFIYTSPEGAAKIRMACRMDSPDGPMFDPTSADEKQKRITVILDSLSYEQRDGLRTMCHEIQLNHPTLSQGVLLNEISHEHANKILVCSTIDLAQLQVAPPQTQTALVLVSNGQLILQHTALPLMSSLIGNGTAVASQEDGASEGEEEEEEMDRSPSPQHHIFSGPIIKLFTYPPPPATGGISVTNEDLFCLNEGEFLNDVIIDFYMKYILLEHLSKEDQARTHIFSSFFYRRLTQKHRKNSMVDEDPRMSLPERRHARVKTWSRHVDLFAKDFIIVPINESAHWYLAIICFPGLRKPLQETIVPSESPSPTLSVPSVIDTPSITALDTPSIAALDTPSITALDTPSVMSTSSLSSTTVSSTTSTSPGMALLQSSYVTDDSSQGESCLPASSSSEEPTSAMTNDTDSPVDNTSTAATTAAEVPTTAATKPGPSKQYSLKQPTILIFDSLAGPSRSGIIRTLREYLQIEWDVRKAEVEGARAFDKDDTRGANPKCPQQANYSDCGIFILQYVESFFENPIRDYSIPIKGLTDWFHEDRVHKKREELRELILDLQTALNPDLAYDPTHDGCLTLPALQ